MTDAGINLISTVVDNKTTDAKTAIGLIAGSLMLDNPVALQNLNNPTDPVTPWHWVTLTAADIDIFDPARSKLSFSTWGRLMDGKNGNDTYTFSDVWTGTASIVFFK